MFGQTALVVAASNREAVIVDRLVRAGADRTLLDRHGDSPYHIACRHGDFDTLLALTTEMTPKMKTALDEQNFAGEIKLPSRTCKIHLEYNFKFIPIDIADS